MSITQLLLKSGHTCLRCNATTTSSHWYKEGSGYICAKCRRYIDRRKFGEFQDLKTKRANRKCSKCFSKDTLEVTTPKGYKYKHWHSIGDKDDDEWLCHKCFCRIKDTTLVCVQCGVTFLTNFVNKHIFRTTDKCKICRVKDIKPKSNVISGGFIGSSIHTRLKYKGKTIYVDPQRIQDLRSGYCSWCPNNIHDGSCKQTQIHHINYHDDDPLKDSVELCASCHRKETIRLAKCPKIL